MKTLNLLCFLTLSTLFSQQQIDNNYKRYFKNTREIPFLHLNKTTFFKGEEIWFKVYIQELNSKKLHPTTSNFYVSVFNRAGKLKDQKLIEIRKGIGNGSFLIDSTYTDEDYYIKASTKWMKNFQEDESFVQKIKIIDNAKEVLLTENTNRKIDLQILPEGGHFLYNTFNSAGIVIKDENNRGIQIDDAKIINSKNEVVSIFSTNQFGYGKSVFYLQRNQNYKLSLALENGGILEKKISNIEKEGVIISVHNDNSTYVKFQVKTNPITAKKLKEKIYTVLIHNANSYKKIKVKINDTQTEYSFLIKNTELQPGTNIVTLFNEQNYPLSERIFFNYNPSLFNTINLNYSINKESISLNLFKNNVKKDTTNYYLSVSILPFETKSYHPKNTIYSKFLLSPYVKGNIENPSYYFKEINREKLFELDLLLLTQGWSKYNWNNIFNTPPKESFIFEKGITVKGFLNNFDKRKHKIVFLSSPKNNLFLSSNIDHNRFTFSNLSLKASSNLQLLLSNKKRIDKIKGGIQFSPQKKHFESILIDTTQKKENQITLRDINKNELKNFISQSDNLLNEIVVKGKLNKRIPLQLKGVNYNRFNDKDFTHKNMSIFNFLRLKGFNINSMNGYFNISLNRGYATPLATVFLNENLIYGTHRGSTDVDFSFLFDKGEKKKKPSLQPRIRELWTIQNMSISNFKEIIISSWFGGEIFLYTNDDFYSNDKKKSKHKSHKVPFGFAIEKEYYQPRYISTQNETFYNYGTVYWKPNIKIEKTIHSTNFKFPSLNQKKVIIYIEGINEKGQLISEEKILSLK